MITRKDTVTTNEELKITLSANGVKRDGITATLQEANIVIPKGTELNVVDINKYNINIISVSIMLGMFRVEFELPRDVVSGNLKKFDKMYGEYQQKVKDKVAARKKKHEQRVIKKHAKVI